MAVGWAPNRLKADPNGSGANLLDAFLKVPTKDARRF